MNNIFNLFLATTLGSVLGLVGGLIFLFNRKLSKALETNAIPFAAGVLLTVSFLALLPEATEILDETSYLVVLVSFFAILIFEKVLFEIHHHGDESHSHSNVKKSIWLVILGDTIHNFIDGVAIGASFLISPSFGFVTAFSSLLHELPHEVGDFGILLKAKWKKVKIIQVNVLSAIASYFGAFSVMYFLPSDILIGYMLSISSGIFLYLGAIDFLPQVFENKKNRFKNILPLLLGSLIMILVIKAMPHS